MVISGEMIENAVKSGKIEGSEKKTLVRGHLIAPSYVKPLKPPYPSWYDPNAKCDYHYGVTGHSIENCTALTHKVQGLINDGLLTFDTKFKPSVSENPLPDHIGGKINMVDKEKDVKIKRCMDEIKTPFKWVYDYLCKASMIQLLFLDNNGSHGNPDHSCKYHRGLVGHSIQGCEDFKRILQSLMDEAIIEFYDDCDENSVNTVGDNHFGKSFIPKPLTVYYDEKPKPLTKKTISFFRIPMTIYVPSPFPYQTNKVVPWRYDYDVVMRGPDMTSNNPSSKNTVNIVRIRGMTRSGRIYTPEMSERARKGKDKIRKEDIRENQDSQSMVSSKGQDNKPMSEKKAYEFLKIIKYGEYSVVDQLNKLSARIFLLSLLLNSESHKNDLLKVLNQPYVEHNIFVEKVDHMVGNIIASNFITFNDDEILPEGCGSVKALHVTVKCKSHIMAKVLIDNGSSINVMPLMILSKLPMDLSHMRNSHMIVRTFYGTRRKIYTIEVVPSSLHQKVKFIMKGKQVCVDGEEDLLVTKTLKTLYIEAAEEAIECSVRAFKLANAT
ncbi:uncharacterized protein LOC111288969 [Durio zibethinus]|uniref:Uncharacterized protein LOC111288969 n=1 Tax=Durio zibethinus TaxID=66656 RepID=A0A6P5Y5C0_DURZI|nr:uncharacterized protein LOC111288969 [Durio zibethinus]